MVEASIAQEVMQAITTVGFPVVACVAMFYMYDKIIKELTSTLNKIDTTLQMVVTDLNDIEDYIKTGKEA